MDRLRVGLLFGGCSVEHEVSVVSARGVSAALGQTDLVCVPLGVTGEGEWLPPEPSAAVLDSGSRRVEPPVGDEGARIGVRPGRGGLLRLAPGRRPEPLDIDLLFPLVHGWGGEDGRLQGTLDLADVAYVGAGVLGSSCAMDKAVARQLFRSNGLAVTPAVVLTRSAFEGRGAEAWRERIVTELGLPVFVKPANGGSSVGIHRVARPEALVEALRDALEYDAKLVVERAVDAREIECAVLGNDEPEASGLGEIVPMREFYDYTAKYEDDSTRLNIPAELDPETAQIVRHQAITAFRALDLSGFARVDFLLERGTERIYVNEVNTLPGFTPISMFPKLWEAAGLPYPRLVERLVELALERAREQGRRRARRSAS